MGAGCPAGAMVGIRRSPRPSNTGNQIDQDQNDCKKKRKKKITWKIKGKLSFEKTMETSEYTIL